MPLENEFDHPPLRAAVVSIAPSCSRLRPLRPIPRGADVNTTYLPDLVRQLQTVSPACTTELVDLDDESHQFGHLIPLP